MKGKDSSRPARTDIPVISNESERSFPGLIKGARDGHEE